MFCHKCGKETVKDAVYCIYCGAKVVYPEHESTAKKIDDEPQPSSNTTESNISPELNISVTNVNALLIDTPVDHIVPPNDAPAIQPEKRKETHDNNQYKKDQKASKQSSSKPKTVLSIYVDENDARFKKRNLIVYIGGVGYHLHELNKNCFGLEFDAKVVARIDAPYGEEKIDSEPLIIPCGKVVDVQITLENEKLIAKIVSEEDYIGSQAERDDIQEYNNRHRRRLIRTLIVVFVTVFITVGIPTIFGAIDSNSYSESSERNDNNYNNSYNYSGIDKSLGLSLKVDSIERSGSYTYVYCTITNVSSRYVATRYRLVKVKAQFKDYRGTIVDTDSTYAIDSTWLEPGESKTFYFMVKNTNVRSATLSFAD